MQKWIKSAEKRFQKMSFWDISLIKVVSVLFGAILGVYFADDLEDKSSFIYMIVLFLFSWVLAVFRFFKKK